MINEKGFLGNFTTKADLENDPLLQKLKGMVDTGMYGKLEGTGTTITLMIRWERV